MLSFSSLAGGLKLFYYGLQFTLAVAIPLVLCIVGGKYLQDRFSLGDWVIVVSIIVAMVFVVADVYSLGKTILRDINRASKKR